MPDEYVDISSTGAQLDAAVAKLAGIETAATADQTGAEIDALLDAELGHANWALDWTADGVGTLHANNLPDLSGTYAVVGHNHSGTYVEPGDNLTADQISEATTDAGVTIDGVLLKDGAVSGTINATDGYLEITRTKAKATHQSTLLFDLIENGYPIAQGDTLGGLVWKSLSGPGIYYDAVQDGGSWWDISIALKTSWNNSARTALDVVPTGAGSRDNLIRIFGELQVESGQTLQISGLSSGTLLAANDATGNVEVENALQADTIAEQTAAAGVTIDGVLLKDGEIDTGAIPDLSATYATAAQGALADTAVQPDGNETITGNWVWDAGLSADEVDADFQWEFGTSAARKFEVGYSQIGSFVPLFRVSMDSGAANIKVAAYNAFGQERFSITSDGLSLDGGTTTISSSELNLLDGLTSIQQQPTEGAFANGDKTKLDGLISCTTANVTSAGALMDSELTDLAGVKAVTISTLQPKPSEGAFEDGDKTLLDSAMQDLSDDTSPTLGGDLDGAGKAVWDTTSKSVALSAHSSSGDLTLNYDSGAYQSVTVSADITGFNFTNWPTAGFQIMIVEITNGGSGTVTWEDGSDNDLLGEDATAPTLQSSGTDIIAFVRNGTNSYAAVPLSLNLGAITP